MKFTLGFNIPEQSYFVATGHSSEAVEIAGNEIATSGNYRIVADGIKDKAIAERIVSELNAPISFKDRKQEAIMATCALWIDGVIAYPQLCRAIEIIEAN